MNEPPFIIPAGSGGCQAAVAACGSLAPVTMLERAQAFVALGANLGEREAQIERALLSLESRGIATLRRSSLYLTEPVGGPPQDWFLNAAAELATSLSPEALLEATLAVECSMGRVRTVKDGPRRIDVDLLLYGQERRSTAGLVLPHPRMHLRRFVLAPLCEIAPEVRHPVLGTTVSELLARCPDRSEVRLFAPAAVK